MLDILEISKIHNRAPGGIISRLVKNNCISDRISARGYDVYKNSDLYKEIVKKNKKNKKNKNSEIEKMDKTTQIDNMLISINTSDYIELQNDVQDVKNAIKELVEMMRAVYEFEDNA